MCTRWSWFRLVSRSTRPHLQRSHSGFFHSLFLGGFSEMSSMPSRKGKGRAVGGDDWHGEDVELTFDAPNITQAAFECVHQSSSRT